MKQCEGSVVNERRQDAAHGNHSRSSRQALQVAWQGHVFQALDKVVTKFQVVQTAWQSHFFEALVKAMAKNQSLQTTWQRHPTKALIEHVTEFKALQTDWQSNPARLWSNQKPKTRFCKLLGNVTCSRPENLQSLTICNVFNQSLEHVTWPSSLHSLALEGRMPKVAVPSSLQSLTFGHMFGSNIEEVALPSSLRILRFNHR